MSKKITVAIVGLGSRGRDTYAATANIFGDRMEIAAIADIIPEKVESAAKEYQIPANCCYSSAEELLQEDKLADIMFICTQDRQHVGHAIPALRKGYDLLLEKPVSPDLDECREIIRVAQEENRKVVVCHVLRYTPFYTKIKEVIDSGIIGDIVSVQAIENVGYWHQAHSFVRGNWANSDTTSPMILQKCCHDMDMLLWLTGKNCKTVSSFGSLNYFNEAHAPEGAAHRCTAGCKAKDNCPYDAEKIYIHNQATGVAHGHTGWPCNILTLEPTIESITEAIQNGPYGLCVFHSGNNVVDHQVVNLNMEDGSTISFTMCGFTSSNSRHMKIMGTLGDITANMQTNIIEITPFGKTTTVIDVKTLATDFSGHGGGDTIMVKELLDWVEKGGEPSSSITALDRSVESHYIAMAAEKSRLAGGACVSMEEMRG